MVRKVDVKGHKVHRGDTVYWRSKHKRRVPFQMDKFEPLSEKWAERFIEKRFRETHPDAVSRAKVCFFYPNRFWARHPDRYDVFKLDCPDAPEYDKIPKQAYPNQIIRVGYKYYLGNVHGRFERIFPPKVHEEEEDLEKPMTKKEVKIKKIEHKISRGEKISKKDYEKLPGNLKKKYKKRQKHIDNIIEKNRKGENITHDEIRKLPVDLQTKVINDYFFRKKQENVKNLIQKKD